MLVFYQVYNKMLEHLNTNMLTTEWKNRDGAGVECHTEIIQSLNHIKVTAYQVDDSYIDTGKKLYYFILVYVIVVMILSLRYYSSNNAMHILFIMLT